MTRNNLFILCIVGIGFASCSADEPAQPDTAAPASEEPVAAAVVLPRTEAPADAAIWIESPADGATVTSPVTVKFGAKNLVIVPAGDQTAGSGHHHLLVNTDLPDPGLPIPADDNHFHFGMGQTETEIDLPPGEHRLQLLAGDHLHIPHLPPVASSSITITVEAK